MEQHEIQKHIGENMKKLRIAFGWTLEDMATATEITKGALSSFENGKYSPNLATAVRICDKMGVNVMYLVGDTSVETHIILKEGVREPETADRAG